MVAGIFVQLQQSFRNMGSIFCELYFLNALWFQRFNILARLLRQPFGQILYLLFQLTHSLFEFMYFVESRNQRRYGGIDIVAVLLYGSLYFL